jgi:protein SCO1/2
MSFDVLRRFGVLLLVASTLAGCGLPQPAFKNTDVTGADCCRDFRLTDHNGNVRTLADFRGKVVIMFFGFTHCPDVCPTTMVEFKSVLQQLGADAARVQVLFVTLDPERDTRELLASYVPAFDPGFLGLYGDLETTAKTAKEFRVFYQKRPGPTPTSYTLDHTAGSYVFDLQGRVRLFVRHGDGGANLAADLRMLLRQG